MFTLTDAQAREVLPRAETVLDLATIVAGLPDDDLLNLRGILCAPGGKDQIAALLRRFGGLPDEERDTVLAELARLIPPNLSYC